MQSLSIDASAAFAAGQLRAYQNILAELAEVEASIRREIRRLSPSPLPSRLPRWPGLSGSAAGRGSGGASPEVRLPDARCAVLPDAR